MNTDEKSNLDRSGEIYFKNGVISYSSTQFESWSLPIGSIRAVGEFTNDLGPYLDDYFLVFLTEDQAKWREASFYAKGRDELVKSLAVELHGMGALELSNSTNWKSRVLWPPKLLGKPLFESGPDDDRGRNIQIAEEVLGAIRANP